MKERIFSNWTFARALYLILGVAVIIQSLVSQQWFGVVFGGYFASMGLFAFGCAAGNCFNQSCNVEPRQKPSAEMQQPDFKENKQE